MFHHKPISTIFFKQEFPGNSRAVVPLLDVDAPATGPPVALQERTESWAADAPVLSDDEDKPASVPDAQRQVPAASEAPEEPVAPPEQKVEIKEEDWDFDIPAEQPAPPADPNSYAQCTGRPGPSVQPLERPAPAPRRPTTRSSARVPIERPVTPEEHSATPEPAERPWSPPAPPIRRRTTRSGAGAHLYSAA